MFEYERIFDRDLPPISLLHGVDESLVDSHALLDQAGGVVDGDVGELGVRGPVLVQDQQQLLRAAEREQGDETAAAARHDTLHRAREPRLSVLPLLVDVRAVSALRDQDVVADGGNLRGHEVPVLLAAEVPGVEDLDARDLEHEHGGAEDVARVVAPEHGSLSMVRGPINDLHHHPSDQT